MKSSASGSTTQESSERGLSRSPTVSTGLGPRLWSTGTRVSETSIDEMMLSDTE